MKPEQDSFDQLRRLLKLKKYEQPPPRFFNDFSSQVVNRIRAGDRGGSGSVSEDAPWLQRLWELFDAKPAIPGAFAAGICGLLVFSVLFNEKNESQFRPVLGDSSFSAAQPDGNLPVTPIGDQTMLVASTNPVIHMGGSLFDQIPQLRIGPQHYVNEAQPLLKVDPQP